MASKTPNYNAKVHALLDAARPGPRVCPISGETWECVQEEIDWWRKFHVPPTDISPMVRRRWLTGFNIGVEMWWNKDMLTGEKILSYVHPDNRKPVVQDREWFAHDWEERGSVEPDATVSIFDQIGRVNTRVPEPALRSYNPPINSVGASFVSVEDSFMVFAGVKNTKRSAYGWLLDGMEDSQDIFFGYTSTESFFVNHVERLHHCRVVLQSQDCFNSSFLFDCRNCEHVFGGFNLRNRKYVWWGEELSQGAWEKRAGETDLRSWKTFSEQMDRFLTHLDGEAVWPENFNIQCDDATGEYLLRCVRSHESFGVKDGTDLFRAQISHSNCERSAYASGFASSQDVYLSAGVNKSSRVTFCSSCSDCHEIEYCMSCRNCEYCFGCVGLRDKKFHIFNTPFTEEAYWAKLDEIKCAALARGEYGNFFPGDFSPSGVEFAVQCFFDYPEEEFQRVGAVKYDPNVGAVLDTSSMIDPEGLPDHLDDCEAYVGKPMIDQEMGRAFAVRKDDYKFYQKLGLPFPRRHYIQRVKSLARMANTFTSSDAACAKCSKIVTIADNLTFKNRKIYCYECYLEYLEVYG